MHRILLILPIVLFAIGLQSTQAQTAFADEEKFFEVKENLLQLGFGDWSCYTDNETKLVYIDFEKIKVNLNNLVVRDNAGKVIFTDTVWNLPVDTIYELDMSGYAAGKYEIEVNSFTSSFKRNVMLN